MNKYLLMILFTVASTASATVTLQPGQCVSIRGQRICAAPAHTSHIERVRVHTVSETRYTNYSCHCKYGIRKSDGPMKGWWFTQTAIPELTPRDAVTITEINYGGDEKACHKAVYTNNLCGRR